MGESKKDVSDIDLCRQHRAGQEALSQLIEKHGGWARTWAKRFKRQEQCCQEDDLLQEARRGLIDAAKHFDPKRGAFTTCASVWIKKRVLAFIDRARQFGAQSDNLHETVDDQPVNHDYSYLKPHFDSRIMKLYRQGKISLVDKEIMRAICAPLNEQEEILKPLWAAWWKQAKRRTMNRIAEQVRSESPRKRGKILRNLEVQQEMWD